MVLHFCQQMSFQIMLFTFGLVFVVLIVGPIWSELGQVRLSGSRRCSGFVCAPTHILASTALRTQGILGIEELDETDDVTGYKYDSQSFEGKLARRGSFDLSYLSDVVDIAFIRRHATSYASSSSLRARSVKDISHASSPSSLLRETSRMQRA